MLRKVLRRTRAAKNVPTSIWDSGQAGTSGPPSHRGNKVQRCTPPVLCSIPLCLVAAPDNNTGGPCIFDCRQLEHPVSVIDVRSSQWATHNVMILRPDERPHWLTRTNPL